MYRQRNSQAMNQWDDLGDISTLADPNVVEELRKGKEEK